MIQQSENMTTWQLDLLPGDGSSKMSQEEWFTEPGPLNRGHCYKFNGFKPNSGQWWSNYFAFLSLIFTSKTVSCTLVCRSWMTSWTSPSQFCHSEARLYLKTLNWLFLLIMSLVCLEVTTALKFKLIQSVVGMCWSIVLYSCSADL